MRRLMLDVDEDCDSYIEKLIPKQRSQVWGKIADLRLDPRPNDSEHLIGFKPCYRVTCGEHRIIYMVANDHVKVFLVGHRGDDAVYKAFERKYRNLTFAA